MFLETSKKMGGGVLFLVSHDNFFCLPLVHLQRPLQVHLGGLCRNRGRDKAFSRKRHSELSSELAAEWLVFCSRQECQPNCRDKIQHEQLHDYFVVVENIMKHWWSCSSPFVSPFQASARCLRQILLHHNSLWGVQEKEKVRVHKTFVLSYMIYLVNNFRCLSPLPIIHRPFSNTVPLFLVPDSTPCPTLQAYLMAMCGRCTSSTGDRWRTVVWILVCLICCFTIFECNPFVLSDLWK